MNKYSNGIATLAATFAIMGSLAGCDAPEERNDPSGDDRGVVATATLAAAGIDMVQGGWEALSASDATGFIVDTFDLISDLFGHESEEEALVTLSKESLDEIEKLFQDTIVSFSFEQYTNDLGSLVRNIGTYSRPDCDPVGNTPCAVDYGLKSGAMFTMAGQAENLWTNFNSDGTLHSTQRMLHVPHMVLVASLRTRLLAERAALDTIRQISAKSSRETACGEAGRYATTLAGLHVEFEEYIDEQFSDFREEKRLPVCGGPGPCSFTEYFKACYDGPDGEYCSEVEEKRISGECVENCGAHLEDARQHRANAREALYEERIGVILGGDDFESYLDTLQSFSESIECGVCLPQRAIEAGPLWNHAHAQEVCPDVCGNAGGTFTKSWWTTEYNVMSVCQCEFSC